MPTITLFTREVRNETHNVGGIFYRVKCDDPADARYADYLGTMLEEDVNCHNCKELIPKIAEIESGKEREWTHASNGWITEITRDGVAMQHQYIDDLQDEELGRFTLQEFKTALAAWCQFLSAQHPASLEVKLD